MKPNTPTEKGGYGTEAGRIRQSVRWWPTDRPRGGCGYCAFFRERGKVAGPHLYRGEWHR